MLLTSMLPPPISLAPTASAICCKERFMAPTV
jgi:hypothetical protein